MLKINKLTKLRLVAEIGTEIGDRLSSIILMANDPDISPDIVDEIKGELTIMGRLLESLEGLAEPATKQWYEAYRETVEISRRLRKEVI